MSLNKSDIIPHYCIGEDLHTHIIEILPTSRGTAPPKVTSPNDFSKQHGGLEPQSQSTCTFHSVYLFRHYATSNNNKFDRFATFVTTGPVGFEPTNAGVKVLFLNRFGDGPKLFKKTRVEIWILILFPFQRGFLFALGASG